MFTSQRKKKLLFFTLSLFIFLLTLYFSVSAITGRRGLIALMSLQKEIEYNKILLKEVSFEKENLNDKILGLYEKSLDLDLLDEQAKNTLGYIGSNEFMIILNQK